MIIISLRAIGLLIILIGTALAALHVIEVTIFDTGYWEETLGEIATLIVSILLYKHLKNKRDKISLEQASLTDYRNEGEHGFSHSCAEINEQQLRDVVIYNNRGNSYVHRRKYDLAISDFIKATEIAPGYAKAHYNLAYTYIRKGDKKLALKEHAKLETLDEELANKLLGILKEM